MHANNAGEELKEFWMGHVGGVARHYNPEDVEWHRNEYITKALPHLTLDEPTAAEYKKMIKRYEGITTKQAEEIARLKAKDRSMEDRIKSLEEKLDMFAQTASKRETVGSTYKKPKLTFPEWLQKHYPKIKVESFRTMQDQKLKEKILKEWEQSWSEG